MQNGYIIFQGTALDLIGEARGKVWVVSTSGAKPQGNLTIVSTLHMGTSVQYRLVGELETANEYAAAPAEPSLEDSYVWLMREWRASKTIVT